MRRKIQDILRCAVLGGIIVFTASCGGGSDPSVEAITPPSNLRIVSLHDQLLRETGYSGEEAGLLEVPVVRKSGKSLFLGSNQKFKAGELVVLKHRDDSCATAVVDKVSEEYVVVAANTKDIKNIVSIGNFYLNTIHPNINGYRAIAEFSVKQLGMQTLNNGKHILFGDSWFAQEGIEGRLTELLPGAHFINKGVAGNRIEHLLSRFDLDVVPHNPQYVWVLVGTNDYLRGNSADYFISKLQELIVRIHEIGAVAIVFEPSVGPPFQIGYDDYELSGLSHEYAEKVRLLVAKR